MAKKNERHEDVSRGKKLADTRDFDPARKYFFLRTRRHFRLVWRIYRKHSLEIISVWDAVIGGVNWESQSAASQRSHQFMPASACGELRVRDGKEVFQPEIDIYKFLATSAFQITRNLSLSILIVSLN